MFKNERYNGILKILETKKIVSPTYLQQQLFISPSTLRRDLIALEKTGRITRQFGEVALVKPDNVELSYLFRQQEHEPEKRYIANIASTFLGNNQSIFIDSSSTAAFLAPYFASLRNTIVITNGLKVAVAFDEMPQVKTYFAGGRLRAESGATLGEDALAFMANFQADLAFLSCSGITKAGVFNASQEQAYVKRKMMQRAEQVILLCDHSKFETKAYYRFAEPQQITALITDAKAHGELLQDWETQGVEVLQ